MDSETINQAIAALSACIEAMTPPNNDEEREAVAEAIAAREVLERKVR